MMQQTTNPILFTTADLNFLPDNGDRYELINGQLLVTKEFDWKHQKVCARILAALDAWSLQTGLGEAVPAPEIIFSDADSVIPDVVWVSYKRLSTLLAQEGHLTGAPELIVEVLSPGLEQEQRDRKLKLDLYSAWDVKEYWIVDCQQQQVDVYRHNRQALKFVTTLMTDAELDSPLLPRCTYSVARLFHPAHSL